MFGYTPPIILRKNKGIMKVRTKEENAAYSKLLRERKRSTPVAPTVAPTTNVAPDVAPVSPCSSCLGKELEIRRLVAELALVRRGLELIRSTGKVKEPVKYAAGDGPSYRLGPIEWRR